MFTAAKQRNPVSAFSRDGLRISTGFEALPGIKSSRQQTADS
jgi:hypothetical protein